MNRCRDLVGAALLVAGAIFAGGCGDAPGTEDTATAAAPAAAAERTSAAAGDGPPADDKIETVRVADGLYMLTGNGGNVGVATGAEGTLLIDDQFERLSGAVLTAVAAISTAPVRYVFNTHWHPDHSGGNGRVGEAGAVIVAHRNVRRRLSSEQFIEALDWRVPPSKDAALPVVTFTSDMRFHFNGEDIEIRHLPRAHTDGDAIVVFRSANVIHTGDIFFNGTYPFIDTSSGGSIDGVITALGIVADMADDRTRIMPGHGPVADKATLLAHIDMLDTVRDRVMRLIEAGYPQSTAVGSQPLHDMEEQWGGGFIKADKMVQIVYEDLAVK